MLTGRVTLEVDVDRNTALLVSTALGASVDIVGVHGVKSHVSKTS